MRIQDKIRELLDALNIEEYKFITESVRVWYDRKQSIVNVNILFEELPNIILGPDIEIGSTGWFLDEILPGTAVDVIEDPVTYLVTFVYYVG